MIEPVMFFGIGFLVAALLGLLFVPLVHNRAVRLTMRRLEAATPLSIAEIRADKDQLRAEFAMSTRRLEMSVEQMKAKTTGQLAEIGKKIKSTALHEAERTLDDKQADLAKIIAELGERSILADSQRVELAALRTQIEAMKVNVTDYDRAVRSTEERLARERSEAEAAAKQANEERGKLGDLSARASVLEQQLMVHKTEAEVTSRRVQDLKERLREQGRLLAERDFLIARLRSDLEEAAKLENDLRAEIENAGGRNSSAADKFRADIEQLEAQLAAAIEDRSRLQREVSAMKRDAETTWAAERVENALLRERINDVAAEVARLTAVLEGPGSPIETILAQAVPDRGQARGARVQNFNGTSGEGGGHGRDTPDDGKGSLADRIRALQTTASRAAS
jgi:chromosome segregation ATPase